MHQLPFTPIEKRATFGIAMLYSLRMFGLFLILPIFTPYAAQLVGGDQPFLIGIALGIYGMTQAIMQIPMGWLSDHWGRKPIIFSGLLSFFIGNIICGFSQTIYEFILGRFLQGFGAYSSAAIALLADLTAESSRIVAMGFVGLSIALTFFLSFLFGPFLAHYLGEPYIFFLTALLTAINFYILMAIIPDTGSKNNIFYTPKSENAAWNNRHFWIVSSCAFTLHALLTAVLMYVPTALLHLGWSKDIQWQLYLPIFSIAFIITGIITRSQILHQPTPYILSSGICLMVIGEILLYTSPMPIFFIAGLQIFFIGFTVLEAYLPANASYGIPITQRGMAMGIFHSIQFTGMFIGSFFTGIVATLIDYRNASFIVSCFIALIWLILMYSICMKKISEKKNQKKDKTSMLNDKH